jgi:hypothetical protein
MELISELFTSLLENLTPHLIEFVSKHPLTSAIALLLGSLVMSGEAIVAASKTTKDDEWFKKVKGKPFIGAILKFFLDFAKTRK